MTISRRTFVKASGQALASLGLAPSFLARPSARTGVILIFLRGGADGLSMVVPHGDPLYYRARPNIAIPARDVVDLDGHFGLHPSLAPLKPLWDDKHLAIVHATGTPLVLRSHADAQRTTIARIKAEMGLEIAVVELDGWDTHTNQGASDGRLAGRLRELADTITAFTSDLGARMNDVVVMTVSDFGRTVRENNNGGTDHGHATAMLVVGSAVHGGRFFGRWPGLASGQRAEDRGLAVTTDVRDVVEAYIAPPCGKPCRHSFARRAKPNDPASSGRLPPAY